MEKSKYEFAADRTYEPTGTANAASFSKDEQRNFYLRENADSMTRPTGSFQIPFQRVMSSVCQHI